MPRFPTFIGAAALGLFGLAQSASAQTYEVIITNITPGQTFTPFLAANHTPEVRFFRFGRPASPELAALAESGDVAPLQSLLASVPDVAFSTAMTDGLLGPGETVSFTIETAEGFRRLSLAAMLIPTNDTFVAMDTVKLPDSPETYFLRAYDAGSEDNDEICANIRDRSAAERAAPKATAKATCTSAAESTASVTSIPRPTIGATRSRGCASGRWKRRPKPVSGDAREVPPRRPSSVARHPLAARPRWAPLRPVERRDADWPLAGAWTMNWIGVDPTERRIGRERYRRTTHPHRSQRRRGG